MKNFFTAAYLSIAIFALSGCSVFGYSGVETAPYEILKESAPFELRHYESILLVSTSTESTDESSDAFRKLFNYISGNNNSEQKISMTAPVFMDKSKCKLETMSFVLPKDFTLEDAPKPKDPTVKLEEIKDYTVATVTFSGTLSDGNIKKNKKMLKQWIAEQKYKTAGNSRTAGYNPPFTIPALRRNEILIPVKIR